MAGDEHDAEALRRRRRGAGRARPTAPRTSFGLAAGSPGGLPSLAEDVVRAMSTIIAAQSGQLDRHVDGRGNVHGRCRRPVVSDATTSSCRPTLRDIGRGARPHDRARLARLDRQRGDRGPRCVRSKRRWSASSDALIFFDTTEPVESSTDPAAAGDSTAPTTTESTSSTTSTSTIDLDVDDLDDVDDHVDDGAAAGLGEAVLLTGGRQGRRPTPPADRRRPRRRR